MSGPQARRRGQPLVVLAAVLLAWVGARAVTWESPFPLVVDRSAELSSLAANISEAYPNAAIARSRFGHRPLGGPERSAKVVPGVAMLATRAADARWTSPLQSVDSELMAGHQLLWLAATGAFPVPSDVASLMDGAQAGVRDGRRARAGILPSARPKPERWSFDAWLLLRPGLRGDGATGIRPASYGASQAGAVVRYRLAPGSGFRPSGYVRASQAFAAGRESELAAGVAARPVTGIPLALHAELRAVRASDGAVAVRPAAFVVSEFPPVPLPLALRGKAYVQAGYVAGDFETAFVDGQARADREVARFDLGSLRAGAGVWGGAQKGAARLDVGPSASLHLEIAETPARVAVDYRMRVAGDAAPGTGVAVTLSTGF